jgi:hypothetical protein
MFGFEAEDRFTATDGFDAGEGLDTADGFDAGAAAEPSQPAAVRAAIRQRATNPVTCGLFDRGSRPPVRSPRGETPRTPAVWPRDVKAR